MWIFFCTLPILVYVLYVLPYYTSAYFRGTRLPFLYARTHKGVWGEFKLFRAANKLPGKKRWLFNLYLPKQDRETTEIDAVLIHESGIYVFESKNLSGSIRGEAEAQDWHLTVPSGQDYLFYNPLLQNKTHCDQILHHAPRARLYSIVVFGDNAVLGDVPNKHDMHHVCTISALPTLLSQLSSQASHAHSLAQRKLIETTLCVFARPPHFVKRRHKETILRRFL